jgi:hypothetical protein
MTVVTTAIADFSAEAASGFRVVEPDETLNLDALGEEKADFAADEPVWFWVQHDSSLEIDRLACTDPTAMISDHGTVRRSRDAELVFTGVDEVELPYIPAAAPVFAWRGSVGGGLRLDGRKVEVQANLPCACSVTIPIDVHLFCLQPPHSEAQVVVYFNEVSA